MIKILDVTLRDGGCVNNFDFGEFYMNKILNSLEEAHINYIEVGYIDENSGTEKNRTQFYDEKVIEKYFLKEKKKDISYVAMIDYNKFNVDNLETRTQSGIDGIRLAFHKEDYKNAINDIKKIIDKGYEVFIQPMLTMRYNDIELLNLINLINEKVPNADGFYLVDTFGEMKQKDLLRLITIIDFNLQKDMLIGLHSHNNLQLSFSNAIKFLEYETERDVMLDSSVFGMGKGAGNLNTELIINHLNFNYKKNYNIYSIIKLIDEVISVIYSEIPWGYSIEYFLSSINNCTPSYASHFSKTYMLDIEQTSQLLEMIDYDKRKSFDIKYANELYYKFRERENVCSEDSFENLTQYLKNKKIILIATGKSIINQEVRNNITKILESNDTISISLNNEFYDTEYILITRQHVYNEFKNTQKKLILTSNINANTDSKNYIIEYNNFINKNEDCISDGAGTIALNLLKCIGVSEIILAGFDGYDVNINNNYYDDNMRKSFYLKQIENYNNNFKNHIDTLKRDGVSLNFLYNSKYLNGDCI